MEFKYVIKKEQLKKYLYRRHLKINISGLLFFMIIAILINYKIFSNNVLFISLYVLFITFILGLIIFIVDYLFVKISVNRMDNTCCKHSLILENNKIIDKTKKSELVINKKDIKKIKVGNNIINIKIKNKPSLVLLKVFFSKKEFNELRKVLGGNYDTTH